MEVAGPGRGLLEEVVRDILSGKSSNSHFSSTQHQYEIYIYTYIYIYMHVSMYMYICVYTYVYIHMYIYLLPTTPPSDLPFLGLFNKKEQRRPKSRVVNHRLVKDSYWDTHVTGPDKPASD